MKEVSLGELMAGIVMCAKRRGCHRAQDVQWKRGVRVSGVCARFGMASMSVASPKVLSAR